MDEFTVTCVQQQIRVFENHEEFRGDVQRFMRLAKVKESHLVIFPELSGLLLVPPLAPGLKRTLLKMAERQIKKSPSILDRMIGRAADSAAGAMGGISRDLAETIIEHENTLRDVYLTIFSETAREYGMYILGGSIYLPDTLDGQIHNMAFLFGPTGDVIGQQSKITLNVVDRQFCQPAIDGLKVFATDFGKLGILIGEDVLYPESGRILAGNGATAIVNLLAATNHGTFLKTRHALTARLQENLALGAQSCLVGKNILGQNEPDFVGRSTIFAPMEMTSRYSGVLGEVGSMVSESIISTTWDMKGLLELRQTTITPTFIIPDDKTLRNQIGKEYGLSEGVEPPTVPIQPAAIEESDVLSLAKPSPPEQEWVESIAALEQTPEESNIIATETFTAPEGREQAEAPIVSEGEEATLDADQWPMAETSLDEELMPPIPIELEEAESDELPIFAAHVLDELEELPNRSLGAELEELPASAAPVLDELEELPSVILSAESDDDWTSKLWDDAEDTSPGTEPLSKNIGFLEDLRVETDSKPEQNLDFASSVPPSEEQTSKEEDNESRLPFSRLKTWWSKREKRDS